MNERDLQRWSREVAEDPGAPSFVRLARAYRRQGRRTAARDTVVRGLEHNPEHLAGHCLLALLYVEDGDPVRARDEWEIVLRLEPGNFDASRGLGFLALERDDLEAARRHLEQAARGRPNDATIGQALEVLERRAEARRAQASAVLAGGSRADADAAAPPGMPAPTWADRNGDRRDPAGLFEALREEGPFVGALVLDEQGMVLAGSLEEGDAARAEMLGALLNGVVGEAGRATGLLELGAWEELMVECDEATLHLSPLSDGVVVVVARPRTPAGWVLRLAGRAARIANGYLEGAR